jgi:hypothetical protein
MNQLGTAGGVTRGTFMILGLLFLVSACVGGDVSIFGASIPNLKSAGQWSVGTLGVTVILAAWLYDKRLDVNAIWQWALRGSIIVAVLSVVVILVLFSHHALAEPSDPPAQSVAQASSCPPRDGLGTVEQRTDQWIFLGNKSDISSDALDGWRTIKEQCIPRHGEKALIYRATHVWQGNPEQNTLHETQRTLRPGTTITIQGSVYGPRLYREASDGTYTIPLHFEAWASFK